MSAIVSFLLGVVGWLGASFFGKPLLDFLNLRSQVHEEIIFTANIGRMAAGTAYDKAVDSLRRLGAKVHATNDVTAPLPWHAVIASPFQNRIRPCQGGRGVARAI